MSVALLRSRYTWDDRAQQYRDARGKFVSRKAVRNELDVALEAAQKRGRDLAKSLRDGRISIAEWQRGMVDVIRTSNVYSAAAAKGGWAQMTAADWARTGPRVREQLTYLRNFADQVANGRVDPNTGKRIAYPLDGRFEVRAGMYGQQARTSFYGVEMREKRARGVTEAKRVLGAADRSCGACSSAAAAGWQPIEDVPPIGTLTCLSMCKCEIEYRAVPATTTK